jgi:hypothetical protein
VGDRFDRVRGLREAIDMRGILLVVCTLCASCTPIEGLRHASVIGDGGPVAADTGTDDSTVGKSGFDAAASVTTRDAGPGASPDSVQKPDTSCSTPGARACAGRASLIPLQCDHSVWQAQTMCQPNERCDTSAGPTAGLCRAIAPECVNRASGVAFCDGDQMRACAVDLMSSELHACPAQRHCMLTQGEAKCVCLPGSIEDGNGCRVPTDCAMGGGGCDPLSTCSMSGATRVCSGCPSGYFGTGSEGCAPLLRALTAPGAVLTPALAPDVTEYHMTVPMLAQRVAITATGPANTTITWNGAPAQTETAWVSPVLKLGVNPIELVLTSQYGVSRKYTIVVERTGKQQAYVKARMPSAEDSFGFVVALSGDTLVAGALYEDSSAGGVNGDQTNESAADSGAAFVFVRQGDSWVQQAYLKADSPVQRDFFGASVAISGDTIAVGAIRADPWHGASGVVSRAGAVYVFVRNAGVWSQQARLQPAASAADDLVGISLALQGDTLVLGAPNDSSVATHSGAAHVFTRTAGAWHEAQTLKQATPVREAVFGSTLALDGDTLAVGAPYDATGATAAGSVDVFVRKDDKWSPQQTLRAPTASKNAVFGESVALRGDTLAIGAPHSDLILTLPHGEVHTFDRSGTQWTPSLVMSAPIPRDNDYFGASLGLTATALLVGANGDSSGARGLNGDASRNDAPFEGAAYLYSRQGKSYTQSAYLKAMNAEHDDAFGEFVALSDDAIVVSAIYESGGVGGINGDQADNSVSKSGAVYVFR